MVIGHGPHVVRGMEVYRDHLIAYSLGNFATAMYTLHCRVGFILSLRLARDAETGRVDWHRPEPLQLGEAARDVEGCPTGTAWNAPFPA